MRANEYRNAQHYALLRHREQEINAAIRHAWFRRYGALGRGDLEDLAFKLARMIEDKRWPHGLVYLYDVSAPRMGGNAEKVRFYQ
jgi:hypothetical protein